MQPRVRASARLGLLLSLGCSDPIVIIHADSDELVIAAVFDGHGRVVGGGVLDRNDALRPTVPANYELVAWALRRDELVGLDGAPLGGDQLKALVLEPDAEGCGRCLLPSIDPPLVIEPGSECAIPPFARLVSGETAPTVMLTWPGPCPCVGPRLERHVADPIELRPIAPNEKAWPVGAVAISDEGELGIFHEHLALRAPLGGPPTMSTGPSVFDAPVIAASALGASRFVVAMVDYSVPASRSRLMLVNEDLQLTPLDPLATEARSMVALRDGSLLISGRHGGPSIERCYPPFLGGSCLLVLDGQFPGGLDNEFTSVRVAESGEVTAVGNRGSLLVAEGLPSGQSAEARTQSDSLKAWGTITSSMGEYLWRYESASIGSGLLLDATVVDGFLFSCSAVGFESVVKSAPVSNHAFETGFEWTEIGRASGHCDGYFAEAQEIIMGIGDGALRCTASACEAVSEPLPGRLNPGPAGRRVVVTDGAVGRGYATSEGFEEVFGDLDEKRAYRAAAAVGDEAWFFGVDGEITVVRADGAVAHRAVAGLVGRTIVDAAFDTYLGEVIALGEGSFLARIGLDLSVTSATLPAEWAADFEGGGHVAVIGPGRYSLAGASPRLFVWSGGEFEEVEIAWDDPTTERVEELRTAECIPPFFSAVAGGRGGALAVGCNLTALRVLAYGSHPKAVRASVIEAGVPDEKSGLPAVQMDCADVAAIGMTGRNNQDREHGRVIRMGPGSGPVGPGGGSVVFALDDSNENALSLAGLDSQAPSALVGSSQGLGSLVLVFRQGSAHRVGATRRSRLGPVTANAAVMLRNGSIVVGGSSGHLFRAESPDLP
ncbi:MAG: hypothetical protein HY791_31505 [Deltaproteobacteria bacterium]|nr:hypothetical protein [Deltaproteobacteria bacterium]